MRSCPVSLTIKGRYMIDTLTGWDQCKIEGHIATDVANPRLQGLCGRCGRVRGDDIMQRDIDVERRWLREAADAAQYVSDPAAMSESLNAFRESRVGTGPWINVTGRDWIVEALEEVADQCNYVMAAMQQLQLDARNDEDSDKCEMLLRISLGAALTSFSALMQYRTAEL